MRSSTALNIESQSLWRHQCCQLARCPFRLWKHAAGVLEQPPNLSAWQQGLHPSLLWLLDHSFRWTSLDRCLPQEQMKIMPTPSAESTVDQEPNAFV